MLKLLWAVILVGSALIAYPHLTHREKYHESFSEIAIDAMEYPRAVKVLPLVPLKNSGALQEYLFGTQVTREYAVPQGWSKGFQSSIEPLINGEPYLSKSRDEPKPQYIVRFEGRMGTVDVVVCAKSNRVWFLERGRLRPFFSRQNTLVSSSIEPLVRSAMPVNRVKR